MTDGDHRPADFRLRPAGRLLVQGLSFVLAIGLSVSLAALAILAIFAAPADRPTLAASPQGEEILRTFAGIPPAAWLVERIGAPYVRVDVLVQPGQDPHIFDPTPRQVIELGEARLFFRVGMPFEDRLVERITAGVGNFTVVDSAAGIARRPSGHACEKALGADQHDPEEEGGADPHVWLSPPLLKTMAGNVAAALCRADPRHAVVYRANLRSLDAQLDALDHRIAQCLAPYRGQAFYVFHPAFGYFADTYGLRQESVEVEGKLPTPRQVFELIAAARADRVKIIFLQPQFNQQIARSIADAIGGTVMPMDDLAFDVAANLDDVAQKIAAADRGK